MLKNFQRTLLAALAAAWFFDWMFWQKIPGVSYLLFVLVLVLAGLFLSRSEETPPAWETWPLLVPVFLFAFLTFWRLEPLVAFLGGILSLALLALFTHSFRNGRWARYSLSDYAVGGVQLFLSSLINFPIAFSESQKAEDALEEANAPRKGRSLKPLGSVLRGILIALPVVLLFGALLSVADPVFEARYAEFMDLFNIENLGEYLFRLFYIVVLAYFLVGLYMHAFYKSADVKLVGEEKPWMPAVLGFTEAAIVLGSVEVLFLSFVGIQFQYFFGGQANIATSGYTYAEYARRGFGELVAVAFLSLLMYVALSTITRRENRRQGRAFSGMGVLLAVLIGIILVSAFQRLLLYESAFGFTRLRTYPHVFMVWLGILLAAFVGLELMGRARYLGLAAVLASMGFALTLAVMNVDAAIVQQNVARAKLGYSLAVVQGGMAGRLDDDSLVGNLDTSYLFELSLDAAPMLIRLFNASDTPQEIRDELAAVLVCQRRALENTAPQATWQSFHFSRWRAARLFSANEAALDAYPLHTNERGRIYITVNGQDRYCIGNPAR